MAKRPRPPRRAGGATGGGRPRGGTKRKASAAKARTRGFWQLAIAESVVLLAAAGVIAVFVLGRAAERFAGGVFSQHTVPFAATSLGFAVVVGLGAWLWFRVRSRVVVHAPSVPLVVALAAACGAAWFSTRPVFREEAEHLRTMLGGRTAAAEMTLTHQVYAAYRRADHGGLLSILERGRVFEPTVREAAEAFRVDHEVLMGIAATESSFYPRPSQDGGQGLFQITAPPAAALATAQSLLRTERIDPLNQRHNAFVAAATFRRYLQDMGGDLFLGLLAYNIGPQNGGLRSIMRQYGARDFVTIQPYLQPLPREYPIRVLTAALGYRIWRNEGRLLRYEEGDQAKRIQALGVPGLRPLPEIGVAGPLTLSAR